MTNVLRVLSMGDFSTELCGGAASRTGDIGLFRIISESAPRRIRRIEGGNR